jgi:hypothetical protein
MPGAKRLDFISFLDVVSHENENAGKVDFKLLKKRNFKDNFLKAQS